MKKLSVKGLGSLLMVVTSAHLAVLCVVTETGLSWALLSWALLAFFVSRLEFQVAWKGKRVLAYHGVATLICKARRAW